MDLAQAIKKYENHLREDVIWSWQDADKYIYINEGDEDLQKWRIKMPEPPDWAKLVNFGLHAKHQVFVYEKYPPRLVTLVEDVEHKVYSKRTKFDTEPSLERAYYKTIWTELRRRNKDFEEEIAWIQSQWYYRLYGKWIMIAGSPVFLDGWHWFYLNYWPLEGTGELPEYRQRDMKWFHAQRYAYTTTETIDYKQETNSKGEIKNKVVLLEDGTPKMKDVGFRTVFGTNNLKGRRVGETSKTCAINYCMGTEGFDRNCGLQGNSENTAEDIYDEKLLYAFNKMPFFFVPQMPTINTQTGLYFAGLKGKGGLNSKIGFATTSRKEFYDQKRLDFYHADECFGKDTKVLMYDGSVKNIQDIQVGDCVVGEDGNAKRVLKTNKGVDQLYKVDYKKGDGFICNGSHILKLYDQERLKYCNLPLYDYLSLSRKERRSLVMYKYDSYQSIGNESSLIKFRFAINKSKKEEYYGITVEDHSFLLKDFTVVHNCGKMKLESIIDRHGVVKRCCSEGAIIKGLMIYTSTAEDMDHDAGIRFEKLSDDSMFEERMVNGQTKSGLINVYFPMYEAYYGFIDKYGEPIIDNPTDDQVDSMKVIEKNEAGEIMGAKEYLESIEKDLAAKGALRDLAQHQRQHPKRFRECFALAIAGNNFNTTILKERITELKFNRDKKVLIGDYIWSGPKFESDVFFRENPDGKWYVSAQLSPLEANQSIKYDGYNKMPKFDSGFIVSADAYRFDETDSYRESKGGICVYEMFNPTIDGEKNDPRDYKSERFVATYLDREETKELYAEEVLKVALYWNALVYPEINVTVVQDFFIRKSYRGYLHFDVDEFGYKKKNCGFNTAGPVIKQKMFTYIDTWINLHASKCEHRRLLEECLMIRGPKYTKDFDLFVSMAGCLLGAASRYTEYIRRFGDTEGVEVGGFWGVKSDSA